MKLPATAHILRPWRVHEIAPDFTIEDVWALPTPGGPDDLPRLVDNVVKGDFPDNAPLVVRALWEARWKIGAVLGWDRDKPRAARRPPSLLDRLPDDLRRAPRGPELPNLPFTSLYLLHDEWAAEMINGTAHAIMHMGWVPDGAGGHRGQMAVLVKPNGLLGTAYMAAIKPFRHLIVYPALMRRMERGWRESSPATPPAAA
ncbi:DUF2867 domain-containing protein [Bailinhaonella thermotolerans]|uniref:DUF2867 domain-containing protein n=1 Tax=Bailinhaonella thermotolerans TaxID=1070861 RepID=A0A3A4ANT8_9ACTN|nr:DUF2867 domain-containing protein [Bailinhaonella thermotolerans]RJL27270.1 DUF2867 domain-containing protein [Bailinhaonella thermotolerans]